MGFNPFKSVGKAVKKVTKPFKKVLRSPIGKAAMLYAAYHFGPMAFKGANPNAVSGLGGWQKVLAAKAPWAYTPGTEGVWAGVGSASGPGLGGTYTAAKPAGGILGKAATWMGNNKALTAAGLAAGAGAMGDDVLEESKTVIDTSGHEGYLNSRKMYVDEWTQWLVDQGHDEDTARAMAEKELFSANEGGLARLAQGGRIGMFTGAYGGTGKGHAQGKGDSYGDSYSEGQTRGEDAKEKFISKAITPSVRYKKNISHHPSFDGPITTRIRDYYDPRGYQKRAPKPFSQTPQPIRDPGGQGAQTEWQRLGYPSYAAWLAAQQSQGGGGTGTDGVGDYYGFKEWEDWAGAPTTPMFGDATQYQRLLSKGGRIGLYAGGMGGMNNSMNPMMNQGLGAMGSQGMNPYNQQNLMAQGQMRGQPQARPPMPGGPTTAQGPGLASLPPVQQNKDNELLKLIRMLASMGIPMEQLRGRTKEELVEMVMSLSAKAEAQGGGEEVVEEQEEVLTAAGGGRVHAAGGLGEMYPPQGSYPNSDLEFQTEEQASSGNPGNAEMYLEEDEEEEIYMPRAGGGLMRTGYAMGSEQPVIPSRDGSQLDFRGIGGYQPHGAKEKKDDVRALLAQGEFVVTSDAVKGIGEGDRDLGAKRMYDMMHKYEPIGRALS